MFGGEERFKNPAQIFFRNAAAGIGDVDYDEFAGFYGVGAELVRRSQRFNTGGNRECAVAVNGVFGINGQINDNL